MISRSAKPSATERMSKSEVCRGVDSIVGVTEGSPIGALAELVGVDDGWPHGKEAVVGSKERRLRCGIGSSNDLSITFVCRCCE